MEKLTAEQFDALAQLRRLRPASPLYKAARMILVEGHEKVAAMAETGAARQNIDRSLREMKKTQKLAETACASCK